MDKTFRSLIIISVLIYIIFYILPSVDFLWLSQDELDLLKHRGEKALLPLPMFVINTLYSLWLFNSIGLFFYFPLSRKIFVILLILSIVLLPFSGYVAYSPLEKLLTTITNTIEGALLIIMYFTSLRGKF